MQPQIDDIDLRLIKLLQRNGRQSSYVLARALDLDASTVQRRIKRLTDAGILRITIVAEPSRVGLPLAVIFGISFKPGMITAACNSLARQEAVKFVSVTTGRYDAMVFNLFKDEPEMSRFHEKTLIPLTGVRACDTFVCLNTYKGRGVYFQGARLNTVDPVLDNRLLELLTHDGRQSAAVLASQLGVKAASVRRRIKQLISEGTIRIIAVSSLSKVGAGIVAIIGVRTSPGKAAVVGEHLANQGNPRFVATTSGGFDVMVWGRFQSLDEMAYFTEHDLNQLDGVMSSETFVCLRVVRGDMVQL